MINKVILVGNVGTDPEIRTLESGAKVARIRLATTERIFDRQANESKEHTEWHTVTLWRGLADVADRFVRKGSQIYIEGRLRSREWTDRDNNKRSGVEVVADELKLLGRRGDAPQQQESAGGTHSPYQNYGQQSQSAYGQNASAYGQQSQPAYGAPQNTPAPQAPVTPSPSDDPDDLPF